MTVAGKRPKKPATMTKFNFFVSSKDEVFLLSFNIGREKKVEGEKNSVSDTLDMAYPSPWGPTWLSFGRK